MCGRGNKGLGRLVALWHRLADAHPDAEKGGLDGVWEGGREGGVGRLWLGDGAETGGGAGITVVVVVGVGGVDVRQVVCSVEVAGDGGLKGAFLAVLVGRGEERRRHGKQGRGASGSRAWVGAWVAAGGYAVLLQTWGVLILHGCWPRAQTLMVAAAGGTSNQTGPSMQREDPPAVRNWRGAQAGRS